MKKKILIAEDDRDITEILKLYFENENYEIFAAENGEEALKILVKNPIDLAIVDVMMPKMNGYELIKGLRSFSEIPVIILSAQDKASDKILGLNVGADDYITKPFEPLEIVARVNANLRRKGWNEVSEEKPETIKIGSLVLNPSKMSLTKDGEIVFLTSMEYRILAMMINSPGKVFTKAQLYNKISGEYIEGEDNAIMVHVSKLRDKMEPYKYIKTIRGLGYKFEEE